MAFTSLHKAGYDIFVMSDPLSKRKRAEDLPLTRFAKREQGIEDKTFVERQQERQEQAQAEGEAEGEATADSVDAKIEKWVSDQMSLAAAEAKSEVWRSCGGALRQQRRGGTPRQQRWGWGEPGGDA